MIKSELPEIIGYLRELEKEHPGILKAEFFHFLEILRFGASKYSMDNWSKPDGITAGHKDTHASMFRHLAQSSSNIRVDAESGHDHLLHVMCRAGMCYTRKKRGIEQ